MKRESFARAREINDSLINIQDWRKWIEQAKKHEESGLQLSVFNNGDGYNGHNFRLDFTMQIVLYGFLDTLLNNREIELLKELATL